MGILVAGAILVVSGCNSASGPGLESATSTAPSIHSDVPTGFDSCTDIPQSLIASERLTLPRRADSEASGGVKWLGCNWVQSGGGYGASIKTTNITVDMVRSSGFADTQEFTIGGRSSISSRQIEERLDESCTVNVEMRGGSLEVSITNPPSAKTSDQDTCEIARQLSEKLVPSLPAGD
ncbi:DUF3558 domain-containing protein [Nocardia higoensis]|uniref:DUF3558 domain-containing protein n=1 Tax=Nocardia higoensis TaxID=228599 RepID=UPI001FE1675A|nr:DUF3558 domain-containing protein [Nocardia higoensis]